MPWDSDHYDKFIEARSASARDLQALIPDQNFKSIIDLNCGTGQQTLQLAQRFPKARILGIDRHLPKCCQDQETSKLSFKKADFLKLNNKYDLIYSNAALQWRSNHPSLIDRLWNNIKPGGCFVFQVAANYDFINPQLMIDTANEFLPKHDGYKYFRRLYDTPPTLTSAQYTDLLNALGGEDVVTISKTYSLLLSKDPNEMIKWVHATSLIPFISYLNNVKVQQFLTSYLHKLHSEFGDTKISYTFKRIICFSKKPRIRV